MSSAVSAQSDVETQAAEFLERFDKEATESIYKYSLASWAYNTNISKETSQKLVSLLSIVTLHTHCKYISHHVVVGFHCLGRRGADLERILQQNVQRVPEI